MGKAIWRIVRGLVGLAVIWFLGRDFMERWHKVQDQQFAWHLRWEYIAASLLVTWAMYGVLIWGWRAVLAGWREHIRIVDAARIWTISSLARYVPFVGKFLAISNMALMSQQRGVSPTAAMGSSIIMQLLALTVGGVLAVALVGTQLLDETVGPTASVTALGLAAAAILSAVLLTSPSVTRRIGFLIRRPEAVRPVEPGALASAVLANLVAWAGYGLALQLLVLGVTSNVDLRWDVATGAFAASYIVGYLVMIVPGGLGVREVTLAAILVACGVDARVAGALAVASRVTLTINELGAAAPFFLIRSKPRVVTAP